MGAVARCEPAGVWREPGAWRQLRRLAAAQARQLTGPQPGWPGLCACCFGPARPGAVRCYQCDLQLQCGGGSLADLVVPVAYASKGSPHARNLWQYKSSRESAGSDSGVTAGVALRALLLVFLREHGPCLWQRVGGRPTHLAVVPSGRGRPGPHPLRMLLASCLALPWADLVAAPGARHPVRDLDPGRFAAARLPGARVLLLDDTWTSGASAQSAAMSLRRAGTRKVTVVVLGRHLSAVGPTGAASGALSVPEFRLSRCALHQTADP